MHLPQDFCTKMQQMLGSEAEAFFQSYEKEPAYGLRLNLLKYPDGRIPEHFPFSLTPVPWVREGFYASYEERPGKHPFHEAGAYYIQEPSAMSVVQLLDPAPGETLCDLCAAPGGKSTQIAARMHGEGLLVSNEMIPSRAKILSENIERFGVTNALVTNETPEGMAARFPEFFDKVLVDAPCSGEGMFRKDGTAVNEWSKEQPDICARRQKSILEQAEKMIKSGGNLVYSTCTFSEEENEEIIRWFLEKYPSFSLENWQDFFPENTGISSGNSLVETMRLFPHRLHGEGHFAARLRKKGAAQEKTEDKKKKKAARKKPPSDYLSFLETYLKQTDSLLSQRLFDKKSEYQSFGKELYLMPSGIPSLDGLKVLRAGLHLGTLKKNRFEPSHALAKAASSGDVFQVFTCDEAQAVSYLHGETFPCPSSLKGWVLVCYEGLSLGFGKAGNGILKNHYPKGLRS